MLTHADNTHFISLGNDMRYDGDGDDDDGYDVYSNKTPKLWSRSPVASTLVISE